MIFARIAVEIQSENLIPDICQKSLYFADWLLERPHALPVESEMLWKNQPWRQEYAPVGDAMAFGSRCVRLGGLGLA